MDKPILLSICEMKEDFVKLVTKWSGELPALFISQTLNELSVNLDEISAQQIEQTRRQYEESKKEESENDSK